ncbi:MAG: c-type cytochrome [Halothiobacillus sp.]|jgi:cytochrome c|nr:c-type cytochrome [Halothiobacillus sp.]
MKAHILAAITLMALSTPVFASGNVAKGKSIFNTCKACHSIIAPNGQAIVRGGKIGPDLYGVIGRRAGSEPGFHYGAGIIEAGKKGLIWNQKEIATYVKDPTKYLQQYTGDKGAHSNMPFKLQGGGGADVAAYLASAAH